MKVLEIRDYKEQVAKNLLTSETRKIVLPKSNILYFVLENEAWFCIRPSGTEPKVKIYFGVKGSSEEDANKKLDQLVNDIMNNIIQ